MTRLRDHGWTRGSLARAAAIGLALAAIPGIAAAEDLAAELKLDCASLNANSESRSIQGFVRGEDDFRRVSEYGANHGYVVKVKIVPWPGCEIMLTLAEPLANGDRPSVRAKNGQRLKVGQEFAIELVAPGFPSFLYVVYLQTDGTVVNLLPRNGPIRNQTAPGATLTFGEGRNGTPRFRVTPPVGTETVVAIAARSPIDELEKLERPGGRPYRLALAGDGGENRAFLGVLRKGLAVKPDPTQPKREVAADVLQLIVEE